MMLEMLLTRDKEGLLAQCEMVKELLQDLAQLFPQDSFREDEAGQSVMKTSIMLALSEMKKEASTLKNEVSTRGYILCSCLTQSY